jgi:hypothetical protein
MSSGQRLGLYVVDAFGAVGMGVMDDPMSASITIDHPAPHQLRLVLRQGSGEVTRFLFFVLLIAGALLLLVPQARTTPAPLLGLVGVAIAWCAVSSSAHESYLFDPTARTAHVQRSSALWRSNELVSLEAVRAVQLAVRGPDDNRRVVELVTHDGRVQLRLPRRLNTLSASDHADVGRLIADHLDVSFRRAPS